MELTTILEGLVFPVIVGFMFLMLERRTQNNSGAGSSSGSGGGGATEDQTLALRQHIEELRRELEELKRGNSGRDTTPSTIERRLNQEERRLEEYRVSAGKPTMWRRVLKNLTLLAYLGWFLLLGFLLFTLTSETLSYSYYGALEFALLGILSYWTLYAFVSLRYLWGEVRRPNIRKVFVAYVIGVLSIPAIIVIQSMSEGYGDFEGMVEFTAIIGGIAVINFLVPPIVGLIYNGGRKKRH